MTAAVYPSPMPASPTVRRRGRPAAATREEVLELAMHRYLHGERIDVQAIAVELGLGRATIYRWFRSRDALIGEVLARASEPLLESARAAASGTGGAALLETFDRFNRSLVDAPALRRFVEQQPEAALRIITSGAGVVQTRIVARIASMIDEEAASGAYVPPVEPATLAYAIVRLAEAFLLGDAVAGMRGDVDRLREVEGILLGMPARR